MSLTADAGARSGGSGSGANAGPAAGDCDQADVSPALVGGPVDAGRVLRPGDVHAVEPISDHVVRAAGRALDFRKKYIE